MNENEVIQKAVYVFGPGHQKLKCIEELSELAKELCKDLDGKGSNEHIAEEIADVEITLAELKFYYDNASLVRSYREKKIARLNNLIFEEEYGQKVKSYAGDT